MTEQIVIRKPYNWFQIASYKCESLVAEATDFYVCLQTKASNICIYLYFVRDCYTQVMVFTLHQYDLVVMLPLMLLT
jgi:hypothetical protein